MATMTVVCAILGALIVLVVLGEAFEALVLPRRIMRRLRLSRLYYRSAWRIWTSAADLLRPGHRKESVLSVFGPLSLLVLFAFWATGLIVGFGLLHHAVVPRNGGLADSLYLSGETFTTLGYGDVTPVGPLSRTLAVGEAATGFGYFAIVISYLPVLYQAFGRREALIAMLDARAGSPPSAGQMILRLPPGSGDGAILTRFLEEAERWAAELLEAQLSYPVLGYYRSQHDNQSWLAAMTCVLDLSALALTVVEGVDRRQARLTFAMARHALVDLSLVMRRAPRTMSSDRLPESRLKELLKSLQGAGVTVREDVAAIGHLTELRGLYEPFAAALAGYFRLGLPDLWPVDERADNWQTSAWMKRAAPLTALGTNRANDHFG
jgi:Ion channel